MKTNAIVRIVLFSLAILVLLGILLSGLGFNRLAVDRSQGGDFTTEIVGETRGDADPISIRRLEIEWVCGDITIIADENADRIFYQEDAANSEKYPMYCGFSGDKLIIRYSEETAGFFNFGIHINNPPAKNLTITLPADWICQSLEIDAASADVEIRGLTIRDVDFDGASGTCDFVDCTVGDMDFNTASGDVTISGSMDSLEFDAASASFYGVLSNTPRSINMDGVSGDLDITLPEDCGFTVDTSGLSSSFHSDFATTSSGGNYVYGDGYCRISVDGVSCDVTIRKGE